MISTEGKTIAVLGATVSVRDLGAIAAKAFAKPDEYIGRDLRLAPTALLCPAQVSDLAKT